MRPRAESNRRIRDLQSLVLPLDDAAMPRNYTGILLFFQEAVYLIALALAMVGLDA